jgi:hypothetical protein
MQRYDEQYLFFFYLDEIAGVDRSRLPAWVILKNQKGQWCCLIQVKDFAVASSFVDEAC